MYIGAEEETNDAREAINETIMNGLVAERVGGGKAEGGKDMLTGTNEVVGKIMLDGGNGDKI